jgi:hypothetical protein
MVQGRPLISNDGHLINVVTVIGSFLSKLKIIIFLNNPPSHLAPFAKVKRCTPPPLPPVNPSMQECNEESGSFLYIYSQVIPFARIMLMF